MAQSAQASSKPPAVSAPSVHPQETTTHHFPDKSYHHILRSQCEEEWSATLDLYNSIDRQDRKIRAFNFSVCRQNAWLAVSTLDRTVFIASDSCRLRWCPICSRARSAFISQAVSAWLVKHPRPKILTLTLAHTSDSLESQIIRLYACFQSLRRWKLWRRLVHGGIWFFQVKLTKLTESWHPHLHILLDSEFIPHGVLKAAWLTLTGDSHIIDIRRIYKPDVAADYVARYSARPAVLSDLSENHRESVFRALHGRRLCGKFGTASAVDLSGKSPADPAESLSLLSWDAVKANIDSDPNLALLWHYFKTKQPLPIDFDFMLIAAEYADSSSLTGISFNIVSPDPWLFPP